MKGWAEEMNGRGTRLGGIAVWSVAALTVMGAHAGGVALLMRQPPIVAQDAPAPALMLELAALPEAVNTDETNHSEQLQDAEEVKTDQVQPEPEPLPEPEVVEEEPPPEPLPEPEVVEEVIDEIDPPVEQAAVALPNTRPKPRPEPEQVVEKVEKKEPPPPEPKKKERKKEQPRSEAANRAASQDATASNRNAATQSAQVPGSGSSVSPAKWRSRLMAHLEKRKRYPAASRAKREEGVAHVSFTIDAGGNVLSARIARSSGFPDLDQAVLDMVRRASPVPPPPPGESHAITAPVRFNLRR